MGLRALAVLCVLGLAACVHAPPPVVVKPAEPVAPPPPWYGDVRALAREVAALRGVELTATFEVVELDDDAFAEALRAAPPISDFASASNATFSEFIGAKVVPGPAEADLSTQLTEAFYDRSQKRIVLRKRASSDGDGLLVVAHELGHVLQDQQGLFARWKEYEDEPLAWRALVEGDAALTALLWSAQRSGRPVEQVIERARFEPEGDALRLLAVLTQARTSGEARFMDWARRPYVLGTRFFADLYAAGGLELVNRVVRGPAVGFEAFVGTERWLEEGTRRLTPLASPPRRLGLFGIRGLLETCLAKADPPPPRGFFERLDELYLDDSFRRSNGVLTWVTAWASHGELGKGFTQTVLKCVGIGSQDVVFDQREGVVAAVVKAPSADGKRLASTAAKTSLESTGLAMGIALPPKRKERAFRSVAAGVLEGETWRHAELGLSMRLSGVQSTKAERSVLEARAPGIAMGVVFADSPSTRAEAFMTAIQSSSSWLIANEVFMDIEFPREMAWSPGTIEGSEQARSELGSGVELRTVRIPVMKGSASVVVWGISIHAGARAQLESWIQSLRVDQKR